jgi:ribose-phosphate pyrophosphokinase
MTPLVFPMPGNERFGARVSAAIGARQGVIEYRRFPDGESYVRLAQAVEGESTMLICTLDRPDEKTLPLLFAARTLKELGARHVGLVAPYLAYMRQDKRFRSGEALTSICFADLVSRAFDWVVTVDPHLHRRASLSEIYGIPHRVVHAAPLLAAWIRRQIPEPLIVGPDEESEQWASEVATGAGAPYTVLRKTRKGDREVVIELPDLARWRGRTPVLVDDIVSSGRTMAIAARGLKDAGFASISAAGVHGIFAGAAYEEILAAGVEQVATANTIPHSSNLIDVSEAVACAAADLTANK